MNDALVLSNNSWILHLRLPLQFFSFKSIRVMSLQVIYFSMYLSYHTSGQLEVSVNNQAVCIMPRKLCRTHRRFFLSSQLRQGA